MARNSRDDLSEHPASQGLQGLSPPVPSSKKHTIADFLSAAEAMDPMLWEAAWEQALEHLSDVASTEAEESTIITAGHYAPEEASPAGESAPQSLMELFFRDALAAASREGRWSETSRRTWNYGVPLIAHAWSGRMVSECVERFDVALKVYSTRGEVAIALSQGPGSGTSVVWIRSGAIELVEEVCEQLSSWFRRFLADHQVSYELEKIERDDSSADGKVVSCHRSVRVTARVA